MRRFEKRFVGFVGRSGRARVVACRLAIRILAIELIKQGSWSIPAGTCQEGILRLPRRQYRGLGGGSLSPAAPLPSESTHTAHATNRFPSLVRRRTLGSTLPKPLLYVEPSVLVSPRSLDIFPHPTARSPPIRSPPPDGRRCLPSQRPEVRTTSPTGSA